MGTGLCLVGQAHQLLLDVLMEPNQLGHVPGLERVDGVLQLQDCRGVVLRVLLDLPEVGRSSSSKFPTTKKMEIHFGDKKNGGAQHVPLTTSWSSPPTASAMPWPASLLDPPGVRGFFPVCLLPPCVQGPSTLSRRCLYRVPICADRFSLPAVFLARSAAEMLPGGGGGGARETLAGGAPCGGDDALATTSAGLSVDGPPCTLSPCAGSGGVGVGSTLGAAALPSMDDGKLG